MVESALVSKEAEGLGWEKPSVWVNSIAVILQSRDSTVSCDPVSASRLTCGELSMGELFVRGNPGQKVHCRRDWSCFCRDDSFLNAVIWNVVSYLNLYGHLLLLWMKWCNSDISVSSWLPARGYLVGNVLGSIAFANTKYLSWVPQPYSWVLVLQMGFWNTFSCVFP